MSSWNGISDGDSDGNIPDLTGHCPVVSGKDIEPVLAMAPEKALGRTGMERI
jgi:hypothetical protein